MPIIPTNRPALFDRCGFWPITQAVMYYPRVEARGTAYARKQRSLVHYFETQTVRASSDLDPEGELFTAWHVRVAQNGRSLKDLEDQPLHIYRSAFYAAQWLRYRIFASRNAPDHNSNGKSDFYAARILPLHLPWEYLFQSEVHILKGRKAYAPVAHLWAACMDDPDFMQRLAENRLQVPSLLAMASANILRLHRKHLLTRAQAYFRAAVAAGVFGNGKGSLPLDQVWQLPEDIAPATDVTFDTPDLTGKQISMEPLKDYKVRQRY